MPACFDYRTEEINQQWLFSISSGHSFPVRCMVRIGQYGPSVQSDRAGNVLNAYSKADEMQAYPFYTRACIILTNQRTPLTWKGRFMVG